MIYNYPNTNFHDLNLDWFLAEFKKVMDRLLDLENAFATLKEYIDEYFRNLDLQEEVNNYFNSLIESGEFYNLLNLYFGNGLVDESKYTVYAQVIPDTSDRFGNYASQGFCIGQYNGKPVAMNCFIAAGGNDDNVVVWTDMSTGLVINKIGLNAGHANSCCYNPDNDHWYIACGGGGSSRKSIIELDITGQFFNEFNPNNDGAWAITYNKGFLYALSSTGHYIYKVKYDDLTLVDQIPYDYNKDENYNNIFVAQGIFCDDNYIYMVRGNTITTTQTEINNQNKIAVYTYGGKFIKLINNLIPVEVEECDILNGTCYASANTTHIALLFKMDLYANEAINYLGCDNNNITVVSRPFDIYIDETYTDFECDGSSDYPVSSIALSCLFVSNADTRLNMHIMSDIDNASTLAIRLSGNYIINIDADNHKLCNIISNCNELYISNALMPGITAVYTIEYHGSRLVLDTVTFGETGSTVVPSRLVFATSSVELKSITINQDADWLYYTTASGYIRTVTMNTVSSKYAIVGNLVVDSSFPIDRVKYGSADNMTPWRLYSNDYNKTYDINDFTYPILLTHITGGTLNNLPAGVALNQLKYMTVDRIRYTANTSNTVRTFYLNDGSVVVDYYTSAI